MTNIISKIESAFSQVEKDLTGEARRVLQADLAAAKEAQRLVLEAAQALRPAVAAAVAAAEPEIQKAVDDLIITFITSAVHALGEAPV